MSQNNPLTVLLEAKPFILLDGAMATELEARGCNLADSLWSAKVLVDNPELIREVHLDYFRAGAQVAITASYQATPAGFAARGLDEAQSKTLIGKSVELARKAREAYLAENPLAGALLVAGSVGPYGAFLADGSEYRGDYLRSDEEFQAFHRPRVEALLDAGADLLACETMPNFAEMKALAELLTAYPRARGSRLPSAMRSISATARRCGKWLGCWQTIRRWWRWALTVSRWRTPPPRWRICIA